MQGKNRSQKKFGSVFVTAFLLIALPFTAYLLLTKTLNFWLEIFFLRTLCASLVLILLLRFFASLPTPGLKASLLILFWVGFATLVADLAFMDKPEALALISTIQNHFGLQSLLICALLYLVLLSFPFVPGIEIGLLIMAAFGKDGAISVYFATVGGLSLAYFFGYSFPHLWERAGFKNVETLALFANKEAVSQKPPFPDTLAPLTPSLKLLATLAPWLLRYRYLTLAVLINLPGNAILGGGGGISFISGASRQFKWFWFTTTLIIATLPVPLLVYFGFMKVEHLIH